MAKSQRVYECGECGYIAPSYLGKCPECLNWGTFNEKNIRRTPPETASTRREAMVFDTLPEIEPVALSAVSEESTTRQPSGFPELDRVLGGGILPGSYILVGGDPGIGKSTLMLQMAGGLSKDLSVLYVAGEESSSQIRQRATRLGLSESAMLIYPENNLQRLIETIRNRRPQLVVIDSIQALYSDSLNGTPGSIAQVKECAGVLMHVAKSVNVTIFLVGHVTKDGQVSGPKLLEHTVDAVLYLEGEKYNHLRILRTVKNRFGSTNEIGVFEMVQHGLREVENPSELFLSQSSYQNNPGSVIAATLEGTRPMLVEIQALVGHSAYSTPRRVANGTDTNRLHQIVAVLERRLGLDFSRQDIYVNVVGGLQIHEPAADLAIAMAIITSQRDLSMNPGTVVCGEIGLTGEIRPIAQLEARLSEAEKIGFAQMIVPRMAENSHSQEGTNRYRMKITGVRSILDAITASLAPQAQQASQNNTSPTTTSESMTEESVF